MKKKSEIEILEDIIKSDELVLNQMIIDGFDTSHFEMELQIKREILEKLKENIENVEE